MVSPVILFTYKRPWHTKQTIDSLKRNLLAQDTIIFIFSDFYKDERDKDAVSNVRSIIHEIKGFKRISIIERNKHLGLGTSVINGVSEVLKRYENVIVLEDDLVTSPFFLKYMNETLSFYKNDKRIFSISGYNYPISIPQDYKYSVYLSYRASSWGWATWKDRWNKVDWDIKDYGKFVEDEEMQQLFNRGGDDLTNMLDYQMRGYIDSWAIRWCYAHFRNEAYCLHPVVSKVQNIGLDGSGTHRTRRKINLVLDTNDNSLYMKKNITLNEEIVKNFSLYFKSSYRTKSIDFIKKRVFKAIKMAKKLKTSL